MKLTIEQVNLKEVITALKSEEDGKTLRTELNKELRTAVLPAVQAAKQSIQAMPVRGADLGMRSAIGDSLKVQVRAAGTYTGVNVSAQPVKLRGFSRAPAAFNHNGGWRHPIFGDKSQWKPQSGKPGWFDDSMMASEEAAKAAVVTVLNNLADRIAVSG